MNRLLDKIVVVDVEATCWQGPIPEGQASEIIEIGVCLLDVQSGDREEIASILVRPARSTVSDSCTELTTLTQEQVDTGVPFAEACRTLQERYGSGQRTWASYGDYDRNMFRKQCEAFGTPYPFSNRHINVKTLFALVRRRSREAGMAGALAELGLPLEGTHHRAGDDAWNIAAILAALLWRGGA